MCLDREYVCLDFEIDVFKLDHRVEPFSFMEKICSQMRTLA